METRPPGIPAAESALRSHLCVAVPAVQVSPVYAPCRRPAKTSCPNRPSHGINTLVLARLRWPVLKCPPMAGFQVSAEVGNGRRIECCGVRRRRAGAADPHRRKRVMFGLGPATKIYIAVEAIDMRKGFEGLHGLVRDHLGQDPLSGHLFLFTNQNAERD